MTTTINEDIERLWKYQDKNFGIKIENCKEGRPTEKYITVTNNGRQYSGFSVTKIEAIKVIRKIMKSFGLTLEDIEIDE